MYIYEINSGEIRKGIAVRAKGVTLLVLRTPHQGTLTVITSLIMLVSEMVSCEISIHSSCWLYAKIYTLFEFDPAPSGYRLLFVE